VERYLQTHGLGIESGRSGDEHVIVLKGELEMSTVAAAQSELIKVEASGCRQIVLDLRGLSFLDSTGVHLLMQAHARAEATGRSVALLVDKGPVHRVLDVSGALSILPTQAVAA
jgi:anti-sigma B factor antagonist